MSISSAFCIMLWLLDGCSFYYAHNRANQAIRFVDGHWLPRKSRKIRFFFRDRPILHHTCSTCSELPSHIITMALCNNLYLIIWLYHPIDNKLNICTCVLRYRSIGYHNLKANMSIRKQTVWALYSYSWLTRKVLL